ncbi:putative ornithine decarboxylase antizyme protein [Phaeoacremonium minimum UCRPA7]|uniref:Ornithine decarboxylase antizyme n=1 Tax=Phaeoacremonium minimum (strain UCR-PA7) TaxID=1286976 RepID=R8BY10_PHAM7|nr:putative ornithine decarboxylase antizyme protein [Phaeoacremonium minimum UCRPA7]EOO04169.1 putative ornithine decarboxylase antizyme protein [Phaeoacremonium minimum UCRPA7]
MRAVFLGERSPATRVSGLTGVYHNAAAPARPNGNGNGYFASHINNNGQLCTPPDESPLGSGRAVGGGMPLGCADVAAWLEIWDYAGGASFRAFIAEDPSAPGEKALFAFFDQGVVGRDLKQALVALIELAETPLGCSQLVICIDRAIVDEEAQSLTKGLQWAGFSLTTLDHWVPRGLDVTSDSWLFMGMEV